MTECTQHADSYKSLSNSDDGSLPMTTPSFQISDTELNSLLQRYTRDFTAQDREGRFDPITGRDKEIEQVTLILLQRLRKNAILLGPAGVVRQLCLSDWLSLSTPTRFPQTPSRRTRN